MPWCHGCEANRVFQLWKFSQQISIILIWDFPWNSIRIYQHEMVRSDFHAMRLVQQTHTRFRNKRNPSKLVNRISLTILRQSNMIWFYQLKFEYICCDFTLRRTLTLNQVNWTAGTRGRKCGVSEPQLISMLILFTRRIQSMDFMLHIPVCTVKRIQPEASCWNGKTFWLSHAWQMVMLSRRCRCCALLPPNRHKWQGSIR